MTKTLNTGAVLVKATLRPRIVRTIWSWTAATSGLAGLAVLATAVALDPSRFEPGEILLAGLAWVVLAVLAAHLAAWRLGQVLGAPADALRALARIEAEASPMSEQAALTAPIKPALGAELARLGETAVRAAHERNGRINELSRALEASRVEGEARAAFFAGMSHELRTPLNAIIGYAMLLAEDATDAGDADSARDLDRILQSGRRLLRLINDILDLSRMDAGEIVLQRGTIDVVAMMDAVAEGLRDEAKRSGARITQSIGQRGRVMLGDAVRLRQCLNTLVGHAIQCNPGREIVLEADMAVESEDFMRFRLNDDSGRLAAAVHVAPVDDEHEPSPGQVLDADTLAATVAGRLAALLGGRLIADMDTDGVGRLTLVVPTNAGGEAAELKAAQAQIDVVDAAMEVATVEGGAEPRLVLVIDDDEPTIDLLRRWMHSQGYGVIAAMNGAQGLALARSRKPDLIILDIFMPGQSGYEVLAALKADEALRNIPVVVASSDDNRRLGLEAGAAEVMVKPLSRDRLRSVLDVIGERVGGDILVVDDDPNVREMVQRYASQAGMSVRVAENGAEGLAFARRQTPGAIVLDLCMPDTDGFQMMQALAADDALNHVPVMVLSQLDISVDEHTRIREAGHSFHPKWKASPIQIVQNIKTMVTR